MLLTSFALCLLTGRPADLLAPSVAALQSAKTLSVTYTVQRIGDTAVTYKADLSKPNQLRIETDRQLVVADGKVILTYSKSGNTFDKRPQSDQELRALVGRDDNALVGAFFDQGFSARFTGQSSGGKKSVRGVTYNLITASLGDPSETARFYIDPADKVAKIVELTSEAGTTLIVAKEFSLGKDVAAGAFAFTPPSGAADMSPDAPTKVPRTQMPNLNGWSVLPGLQNCCPTSTSNGLLWLAKNDFDNLIPSGLSDGEAASWLAKELATRYKTDNNLGTWWSNMFTGLSAFLRERGYPGSTIGKYSWMGVPHPAVVTLGKEIPELDVIKGLQTRNSFVMIALGWFNNADSSGKAARAGWHWTTLADVNPEEGTITLHDPFQTKNHGPLRLHVSRFAKNSKVVLTDSTTVKTPDKSAANIPILDKYPNVKENQFAIIEGVLVIRVSK